MAGKDPYSQNYGFSTNHVRMWELDHKNGWVPKNFCFQIVVLEKTLKSPLDSKEIKPVNPEGNQSWIFIRMTDAEAEAPILWSPDVKSQLVGKDPHAGKDWRQSFNQKIDNRAEEDNRGWDGLMASLLQGTWVWANSMNDEGQGSMACWSPWSHKRSNIS